MLPPLLASALSVCAPGRASAQALTARPESAPQYNRFQEFLDDTFKSTFWWVEVGGAVAIDQASLVAFGATAGIKVLKEFIHVN